LALVHFLIAAGVGKRKKFHLILHLTGNEGAVIGQWRSIERAVEKEA